MVENSTQLSLKWSHFQENFTSQFGALKEEEQFVDVTFSCQNKLLRAHKVVLSASSPYLTQIFKENPCKHPVIILDDVPYSHLESLLSFIYTGAVNIVEAELSSFLESANLLQIRGLSENTSLNEQSNSNGINTATTTTSTTTATNSCVEGNSRKRSWDAATATGSAIHTNAKKSSLKSPIKQEDEIVLDDEDIKPDIGSLQAEVIGDNLSSLGVEEQLSHAQAHGHAITHTLTFVRTQAPALAPPPATTQPTPEQIALAEAEYTPVDGRRRHSLDPRPCPICNRLYSNLSNLRQHLRLIHNPTVVTCKLCMKSFKTDLYLRRHLISYHDMNLSMEQGAIPDTVKPLLLVKPNQINQTIVMQ